MHRSPEEALAGALGSELLEGRQTGLDYDCSNLAAVNFNTTLAEIETADAVLDAEGWLRTGDVGAWTDGRLKIVDRARDFIVTSGGKTLSPSFIA